MLINLMWINDEGFEMNRMDRVNLPENDPLESGRIVADFIESTKPSYPGFYPYGEPLEYSTNVWNTLNSFIDVIYEKHK